MAPAELPDCIIWIGLQVEKDVIVTFHEDIYPDPQTIHRLRDLALRGSGTLSSLICAWPDAIHFIHEYRFRDILHISTRHRIPSSTELSHQLRNLSIQSWKSDSKV